MGNKVCPFCKEEINIEAVKCPKCQADLRNWFVKHWLLTTFIVIFILPIIFQGAEDGYQKEVNSNNNGVITSTGITTNSPDEIKMPVIKFTGKIDPIIAKKGEKVVITIEIENTDEKQTIDTMRLLFSNKSFLSEGLIISSVMSGGKQDGRAFYWNNDLMKIPPKEKRSFVIVGQANIPGNYESVINMKNNEYVYSDDSGNEELVAKLVVIN